MTPEERNNAVTSSTQREELIKVGDIVRMWQEARWRLGLRIGDIGLRERGVKVKGWKAGASRRAGLVGTGKGGVSRVGDMDVGDFQDDIREVSGKVEGPDEVNASGSEVEVEVTFSTEGLGPESGKWEKEPEERRELVEVEPNAEGNTSIPQSAPRRMTEEECTREIELIKEEMKRRQEWMTSRGYDYQDPQKSLQYNWDRNRRRELDQAEKAALNKGKWAVPPQIRDQWVRESLSKWKEGRRIRARVTAGVMREHFPRATWDNDERIHAFWKEIESGGMDAQGMMERVWCTSQQSSSEKNNDPRHLTTNSDTDSAPSNDSNSAPRELLPASGAENDKSDPAQTVYEDISTEQKTFMPSTSPPTQNAIESAGPAPPTAITTPASDSSDLDGLGDMLSDLIKQNKVKPDDLALASAKQKDIQETPSPARIRNVTTDVKLKTEIERLDTVLKKKSNLIAMIKEMGINVSPEEAAILAADARLVERIEREKREKREQREQKSKYCSWRRLPISGRQDVEREVREEMEKEKAEVKESEKESSVPPPATRQEEAKQNDSSSAVVEEEKSEEVIETETESSEKSLEDLEKDMGDADAEMLKAARFLAGRYVFLCSLIFTTHPSSLSYSLNSWTIPNSLPLTSSHPVPTASYPNHLRQQIASEQCNFKLTRPYHSFAAKEATMKAHLSRRLTYHSILILRPERKKGETGSLAPVGIVLPESERSEEGKGADGGQGRGGKEVGKEVRISISHDGDFATAVCLAVDE